MKYYQRIDINGDPERLPKENGDYIVKYLDGNIGVFPFKVSESHWFTHIEWYEVPVTREEIIDKADKLHERYLFSGSVKTFGEFVADEIIGGNK